MLSSLENGTGLWIAGRRFEGTHGHREGLLEFVSLVNDWKGTKVYLQTADFDFDFESVRILVLESCSLYNKEQGSVKMT